MKICSYTDRQTVNQTSSVTYVVILIGRQTINRVRSCAKKQTVQWEVAQTKSTHLDTSKETSDL